MVSAESCTVETCLCTRWGKYLCFYKLINSLNNNDFIDETLKKLFSNRHWIQTFTLLHNWNITKKTDTVSLSFESLVLSHQNHYSITLQTNTCVKKLQLKLKRIILSIKEVVNYKETVKCMNKRCCVVVKNIQMMKLEKDVHESTISSATSK